MVERCLAKAPEERYGSTLDLARDLKSIGESSTRHRWPRPVAVVSLLAVLLAVVLALYVGGLRETELEAIDSIAVLPLDNLSGDPEQEYFSDGMTEALITELSKVGSLKVISRTSAMRYKDTDKPLPEIARELNVDAVVEGSVLARRAIEYGSPPSSSMPKPTSTSGPTTTIAIFATSWPCTARWLGRSRGRSS